MPLLVDKAKQIMFKIDSILPSGKKMWEKLDVLTVTPMDIFSKHPKIHEEINKALQKFSCSCKDLH